MADDDQVHLFCGKCSAELHPGRGDFYVVRIEAFADPSPPALEPDDEFDIGAEIGEIVEQIQNMSEQELMDQVHRRMVLHLCRRCYLAWIEDPTGK